MDGWMEETEGGWGRALSRSQTASLPNAHMIPPTHTPNLSAWLTTLDHQLGKAPGCILHSWDLGDTNGYSESESESEYLY